MKQFEIMETARQQIIAQLNLADLPYQVDGAEFGIYATVKDGDTEIDVPVTIKVAAHRYADTKESKAYDLPVAANNYALDVEARENAKQARLAEKARKDAEKARAKAQRDAVKAVKKAKREAEKTDVESNSVGQ